MLFRYTLMRHFNGGSRHPCGKTQASAGSVWPSRGATLRKGAPRNAANVAAPAPVCCHPAPRTPPPVHSKRRFADAARQRSKFFGSPNFWVLSRARRAGLQGFEVLYS